MMSSVVVRPALEALMRQRHVRESALEGAVVRVDAVGQRVVRRTIEAIDEHAGNDAQGDVDDVVTKTAAVRESAEIAADDAEAIDGTAGGDGDGDVEADHLRGHDVRRLIRAGDAG